MKKIYRIDGGRYGGEVVVGRVSQEFYEQHKDLEEADLLDALWDLEDVTGQAWYEYDDLEHHSGAYADGGFYITDVSGEDDPYAWNDTEKFFENIDHIYDRECYSTVGGDEKYEQTIPVITVHSAEKGAFGSWFVETDGKLDPTKLAYSTIATDTCELVEHVYYDRKCLETDFDWADTTGKGMYASVGPFVEKWHDTREMYNEQYVAELFAELED